MSDAASSSTFSRFLTLASDLSSHILIHSPFLFPLPSSIPCDRFRANQDNDAIQYSLQKQDVTTVILFFFFCLNSSFLIFSFSSPYLLILPTFSIFFLLFSKLHKFPFQILVCFMFPRFSQRLLDNFNSVNFFFFFLEVFFSSFFWLQIILVL